MPAGEEVLCAVREARGAAAIVRTAARLADALDLRLVIVHAGDDALAPDLQALAPAATVRVYDGAPVPVLLGLGRAVATAWLVIGGPPGPTARALIGATGCPLLVVANGATPAPGG